MPSLFSLIKYLFLITLVINALFIGYLVHNNAPVSAMFDGIYYSFMLFIALVILSDIFYRSLDDEYLHSIRNDKFLKSFSAGETYFFKYHLVSKSVYGSNCYLTYNDSYLCDDKGSLGTSKYPSVIHSSSLKSLIAYVSLVTKSNFIVIDAKTLEPIDIDRHCF